MKNNTYIFLLLIALIIVSNNILYADLQIKKDKNGRIMLIDTGRPEKTSKRKSNSNQFSVIPNQYKELFELYSNKFDLKQEIIECVARAESSFNPNAVSKKGAMGIMQLMPDTAKQYGVKNAYDPKQNIEAGVKHLKYLYKKYNGNLELTLAAYNAGEEAVKKYKGVPPFNETQNYIRRIFGYLGLSYQSYASTSKMYIYKTKEGRTIITDSYPYNAFGKVEIIE